MRNEASPESVRFVIHPVIPLSIRSVIHVNPLQNKETQHVNIVLKCMYRFFEQPNMKGNHA
jgi:hypothetical protein